MKVAFTSSNGAAIDEHFGTARSFFVWEIAADQAKLVAVIPAPSRDDDDEEARIAARASLLSDCAIVYTMQIGGPAAAKLVARRILPLRTMSLVPVAKVVSQLQEVLNGKVPPWLRKAINRGLATTPATAA